MRIRYPSVIAESKDDLEQLERRLRGTRVAIRVRMLLLLKTEAATSLKDVCPLLGYKIAQVTRWWECYKARGVAALVEQRPHAGKASQMTQEAWAGLEHVMSQGHIGTLEEARLYLQRNYHIDYKSVNALSWLFKQRKIKWKTGRRRHRKANQEQQNAFKKTSEALSENNR